jgi:hypothetical protein
MIAGRAPTFRGCGKNLCFLCWASPQAVSDRPWLISAAVVLAARQRFGTTLSAEVSEESEHQHPRFASSQKTRRRVERVFAWIKTLAGLRQTKLRAAPDPSSPAPAARDVPAALASPTECSGKLPLARPGFLAYLFVTHRPRKTSEFFRNLFESCRPMVRGITGFSL